MIGVTGFCAGQTHDTVRVNVGTFEELREQQALSGIDTLTYIDSTFDYQAKVPDWLRLRETGSGRIWGGTMPAVEGIENAIMVKCFDKREFNDAAAFRRYIVEDLVFGKPAPWSDVHISMGKKDLGRCRDLGQAYVAYFMIGDLLYYCKYVLTESPSAYIWVDFTSTQETFDKNVDRFDEFLSGFQITHFN